MEINSRRKVGDYLYYPNVALGSMCTGNAVAWDPVIEAERERKKNG